MPKRLLRSVINFTGGDITSTRLNQNFEKLRLALSNDTFVWTRPEDQLLYRFIEGFYGTYGDMPGDGVLLNQFSDNQDVIERVKDIAQEPPFIASDYSYLLTQLQASYVNTKGMSVFQNAVTLLTQGVTNKEGVLLKGFEAAYQYFVQEGAKLTVDHAHVKTSGDVREEGQIVLEELRHAQLNKGNALGVLTGIDEIDEAIKGAKRGDLWVHAAYPSELKTNLSLNWCYNAITRYKTHAVFFSLEMPRDQIRRSVYALHTAHPKFGAMGYKPISYDAIRYGTLTEEELHFFEHIVIPDFENNPDYGHFEVVKPARDSTVQDIRTELERLNREFEVGLTVLDHGQWIKSSKDTKAKLSYSEELNMIVQDVKNMATQFNHNQGVPVILLWQINREGKAAANKNDGVYEASALTYANNLEKAADVITTTYLSPELREQRRTKISCLKNRDGKWFDPFEAHVNFEARKIMSLRQIDHNIVAVDEDLLKTIGVGL